MKHDSGFRLACIIASFSLILCLFGCSSVDDSTLLDLPAWRTFRQEMLRKYNSIKNLRTDPTYHTFKVRCDYKNISSSDLDAIKTELKTFLSSEAFLSEYIPFARENCRPPDYVVDSEESLPDIFIYLGTYGSDHADWMSESSYRVFPPGTGEVIDNYQGWSDHEYR